jgi:hypothetical protein
MFAAGESLEWIAMLLGHANRPAETPSLIENVVPFAGAWIETSAAGRSGRRPGRRVPRGCCPPPILRPRKAGRSTRRTESATESTLHKESSPSMSVSMGMARVGNRDRTLRDAPGRTDPLPRETNERILGGPGQRPCPWSNCGVCSVRHFRHLKVGSDRSCVHRMKREPNASDASDADPRNQWQRVSPACVVFG